MAAERTTSGQKRVNPAQISAALAKAGYPRAGRYTAWGYMGRDAQGRDVRQDGFLVMTEHAYTEPGRNGVKYVSGATIVTTGIRHDAGQELAQAYAAALVAAGYRAEVTGRSRNNVTVRQPDSSEVPQ